VPSEKQLFPCSACLKVGREVWFCSEYVYFSLHSLKPELTRIPFPSAFPLHSFSAAQSRREHHKLQYKYHKETCCKPSLAEAFSCPSSNLSCGCGAAHDKHGGHDYKVYDDTYEDERTGLQDETEEGEDTVEAPKTKKNKKKKKKKAKMAEEGAVEGVGEENSEKGDVEGVKWRLAALQVDELD
jgi:hypothetical protein